MYRRSPRADARRIGQVLAACRFPAAKWELITYADYYGADSATRAELWSLPVATYPDLAAVLIALGVLAPPVHNRAGSRAQAVSPVATKLRPTS